MRHRSLVIGLLTVAALIAVAAGGYWVWWAGQLERGLAQWREQQRLRGYEITYGGPAIDGFPLAHVARFDGPAIRSPDGARWRGPALTARAPLWDPRTIAVSFTGRHVVERLNAGLLDTATLDSRQADGVLRLRGDGRLESADATLLGLEVLAEPLGRFASGWLRLSLTPDYSPETGLVIGYAFAVETSQLQVPAALAAPLDPTAEKILAVGRLDGIFPQTEPRRALAAWRDGGGALELERVEIEWPPLGVTASGRLTLDDQLRPEGQLAARIAGLPELLDRLVEQGLMTAQQVSNIKLAVLVFAGERDDKSRPVLAAPLIFRAGILSLGPLPLARISPVL
jgi:hypothetical protein